MKIDEIMRMVHQYREEGLGKFNINVSLVDWDTIGDLRILGYKAHYVVNYPNEDYWEVC